MARIDRKQISIKWKMFVILMMFVAVIGLTIWVFQIQMLNYFYQNAKFEELNDISNTIISNLDNADVLEENVIEYGEKHYMDIWVFAVQGTSLREMARVNGSSDVFMPFLTKRMPKFYEMAMNNNGIYIAMISKDHFNSNLELRVLKDNMGSPNDYPIVNGRRGNINSIFVKIYESDGTQYVIVQKSDFTPVQTIASALKDQFSFTGIFLILFALIFSSIMSKFITEPIIKMNESAKRLAKGKYDADFSVSGYREINELAQTLDYAATELSKNDRLQKDLISNISHDLRTPLTMIKGYSEVMRDIPDENTPENVQIIIDETARLTSLVNDMLDLSKIQAGARVPEFRAFCFTDMVRETLKRYERLTLQDGYKIEFISDRDVNVMADSGMILQVIYNLINNAINYTGEDKYVLVKQSVSDGKIRLSVTDTGEGIPREAIPYIWDRYYKVDRVHRRATVGTGLGLSIVKSILEIHNASYGVESVKDKGSTFWFELNLFESNMEDY